MKAPVSWIREHVDLPAEVGTEELTDRLTMLGLKLEAIERPGEEITGPLVVGRVLTMEPEPQKNGKTINWCTVDVGDANGTGEPQGIVCGAHNFAPGDLVVTVLPGGVLPGGFAISARKTYGHVSAGMICSAAELGLGTDHDGIIVLPPGAGEPGQDVRPLLGFDEEIIEFEINPDRAYALSLRGIAREAALGFDAMPTCHYDELEEPPPGFYRLLFGRAPQHTFGRTTNNRLLSETFDENAVWVNTEVAKAWGLKHGERIHLKNQDGVTSTFTAPVKVTEGIRPDCVYIVHGYGRKAAKLRQAYGKGIDDSELVTKYKVDPIMGGTGMNVNFVTFVRPDVVTAERAAAAEAPEEAAPTEVPATESTPSDSALVAAEVAS